MTDETFEKRYERIMLDRFFDELGIRPDFVEPGESPDFIFGWGGRVIGVEVTRIFNSRNDVEHPLQAEDSLRRSIVSKARKYYLNISDGPVRASILFNTQADARSINRDQTAKKIALLVREMHEQLNHLENFEWKSEDYDQPEISTSIDSISVLRIDDPSIRTDFVYAHAGWARTLTAAHLLERIDAMTKLLASYREKAKEVWLLCVADQSDRAQLFRFDNASIQPSQIESQFDRTFFFAPQKRILWELGR